jgi:uncharacterized membrane protein
MKKRPITVTVISWILIAAGTIGLIYHLFGVRLTQPFQYEFVWISAVRLLAVVSGAFMLSGMDWARWLAVAWIGFHFVLSFFHSLQEVVMHGLLFVLITYLLFRPEARTYFRHTQ